MTARPVSSPPGRASGFLILTLLLALSTVVLTPTLTSATPTEDGPPAVAPNRSPHSSLRALAVLKRVATANDTVSYQGTQMVSAWSPTGTSSTLVEVQNIPSQGTVLRVRGSASGPAAGVFNASSQQNVDTFLGGGPVDLLEANYDVRFVGTAKTAGRRALVVDMLGAEKIRAARFWIDRESGLLLRREMYDAAGRTVRASAFVQVRIGRRAMPSHLPPMAEPVVAQTLTPAQVALLADSGWQCPTTIAGYLTLYDTRRVETATGPALHLSYSDGLSTVSVFQQSGTIGAAGLPGYQRVEGADGVRYVHAGIPERVVWSAGDVVYSVLADAPPDVVDSVVAGLPHGSESNGVVDRLGRGLSRVGSWVNPFA